jgi:hypothetical protein
VDTFGVVDAPEGVDTFGVVDAPGVAEAPDGLSAAAAETGSVGALFCDVSDAGVRSAGAFWRAPFAAWSAALVPRCARFFSSFGSDNCYPSLKRTFELDGQPNRHSRR